MKTVQTFALPLINGGKNMKKIIKSEKGLSLKMVILLITILIIVVTTIVIIVIVNKPKENIENESGNIEKPVEEIKDPETKPEITGNENIQESNGIKVNTSDKLKESKSFETYTLNNVKLANSNGITKFTAEVSSTSTTKLSGIDVKIKFMNKEGKYISAMSAYIPQTKPGEISQLEASSTSNLSNAYSYEIVRE